MKDGLTGGASESVIVGDDLTVTDDLTVSDDATVSGNLTVTGTSALNDDVTIAAGKDLGMSGASTFTSGTGAVTMNGNVTVATGKTLNTTDADGLTVNSVIVPQEQVITVPLQLPADAVDRFCFVADDAWQVTSVEGVFVTTAGAGAKVVPTKCAATAVPSAGDAMSSAAGVPLIGTTATVYGATLVGTTATLQLADGEKIGLNFSGTTTGLAGGALTIHMKRI